MEVVREKQYQGISFLECSCSCGGSFFASAEDVKSGTVVSCGHHFAGLDIDRLFNRRYPKGTNRTN